MQPKAEIEIEVVYAGATNTKIIPLTVTVGTTLLQAILQSKILDYFPEIDLHGSNKVGIFNKLMDLNVEVQAGDRVEIYRPLAQSAMELRKMRAQQAKKQDRVLRDQPVHPQRK
ncbi:MAG: RnfH family protein [Candidatus Berkiellales bacterium]